MTDFLPRLLVYAAICAALVGAGAVGASRYYAPRLKALQAEYDQFRGGVEALGRAAIERRQKQERADQLAKEKADRENSRAVADFKRTIDGLRLAADSSRRGELPSPPAGSSRPDLICLDRAEYQREDGILTQRLLQGARGLADEGSKATIDLNSGKDWVSKVYPR